MMGQKSSIEWTRGDDGSPGATWNPTVGCTRVSAGCDHCYAFALHDRRHAAYLGGTFPTAPAQYHRPFSEVQLLPERLTLPLRWREPKRVFVDSMADLFHADVPTAFIDQVFCVMGAAKQHTFMVLTKRPRRMERYLNDPETKYRAWGAARGLVERTLRRDMYDVISIPVEGGGKGPDWVYPAQWPLPNVWLGTSVENQEAAYRIDWLVKTPAAVRFLSCEPLIGSLDLEKWLCPTIYVDDYQGDVTAECDEPLIDWVIAGGESGNGFRPVDLDWLRDLRDQCQAAAVPYFMKQIGGRTPKAGGREIDGRTWDEMPRVAS